jgi:hypothetical protein
MASRAPHLKEGHVVRNWMAGKRRGYASLVWLALLVWPAPWSGSLFGQSPDPPNAVQAGDRWVYDTKDEITGFPKATFSHVVT